jgi:hypothetical protein
MSESSVFAILFRTLLPCLLCYRYRYFLWSSTTKQADIIRKVKAGQESGLPKGILVYSDDRIIYEKKALEKKFHRVLIMCKDSGLKINEKDQNIVNK